MCHGAGGLLLSSPLMPEAVHYPELAARVRGQRELLPALYGDVDFSRRPYRLALAPDDEASLPAWIADRRELLGDERTVELISTTTMLGDVVADAYAALMSQRSFKGLIGMLKQACREGVDEVADAPAELHRFIASMEQEPGWLDMPLVEEGARQARIPAALAAPFVTRGVFVATFLNTYAALPMALTGALSGTRAARRVNETASFFAVTTLPGALERHGAGFEAAAMVRLMHSMVRYNALKRSDRWDLDVYGIPIPQVDQMPAGLINVYLLARQALGKDRTEFNDRERALVEFARYRCHLLGLPEELLPATPEAIVRVMHGRAALLRDGFEDETCGELVRGTMSAYLRPRRTPLDLAADALEKSYSKFFFVRTFLNGDRRQASQMGVHLDARDIASVALTAPLIFGNLWAATTASRIPVLRTVVDAQVTWLLEELLKPYGHAEYSTDARTYTPAGRAARASAA